MDLEARISLDDEQLTELARRVADLLAGGASPAPLLTVAQLAEHLGTTPEWCRRHQAELGAFRLSAGGGQNPIRFRLSDVEAFLEAHRLRPPAAGRHWRSDPEWALR
jgi:hypothetical protein